MGDLRKDLARMDAEEVAAMAPGGNIYAMKANGYELMRNEMESDQWGPAEIAFLVGCCTDCPRLRRMVELMAPMLVGALLRCGNSSGEQQIQRLWDESEKP